ncbi:MAG: xanthine dehydrogenase family protein molybdopterin-binding subunit [Shimia sp.]|uniref:xanthine dehydrogenase family protein molybdopterin-binding subunit n=1 Tax=Shimia sp. TaxID=1954381 RepID=UPI003B8C0940
MNRRDVLRAAGGGLVAVIGLGAAVWSQMPVLPKRPAPTAVDALGWIRFKDGAYDLTLPRVEMGQQIATALKQIACSELRVAWDKVQVQLHDTDLPRVKATVGSESVAQFAEPLAQACASLRDAIKEGRHDGMVSVTSRPISELSAFKGEGLVGASPELVHGRDIVQGRPLYAADIVGADMRHGRVLFGPVTTDVGSRPVQWNAAAAKAVPGYVALVEGVPGPQGHTVGLGIIARHPDALSQIADALAIEWDMDSAPEIMDMEAAIDIDKALSPAGLKNAVMNDPVEEGVWDASFRYDFAFAPHGQIEPRAAVAEWQDGALTVWTGSQDAFYIRDELADRFGMAPENVRVQSMRVGGAFGGKVLCRAEVEAAFLARESGTRVKVQWTRSQELSRAYHRPPSSHRVRFRLSEGRITDWDHQQMSSHIIFTSAGIPAWMQAGTNLVAGDPGVARGMKMPYQVDRARASYDLVRLPVHSGPWRGLGAGPNNLAIESTIDEAACTLGANPVEFRLRHLQDARLKAVLQRVAESSNWQGHAPIQDGTDRTGRGVACGIYKEHSYAAVVADVSVAPDGTIRVTRLWCAHDCGMVINPDQVRAQCEGNLVWSVGLVLHDGLPVSDGGVAVDYFSETPIPAMPEVPKMTVNLVEGSHAPSGAGETVIVAGPGAIANAIRAATGLRPTRFPIAPSEIAL